MNRRDWLLGRLDGLAADARERGDALMTAVWEGLAEEVRRHASDAPAGHGDTEGGTTSNGPAAVAPPASPAPQGARKTDEGTTVTVWLPEINEGDDPVVRQLVDAALSLAATHTASFSARVEVDGEPLRVVSSLAPPPAAPDPAPGLEYATWEPSAATGDPDGLPDTLIVPVVEELRRRGVVTLQSCQGHVGSSDAHLWFRADLTDEQARSLAATPGMAKVTRMFSPEDCWEAWWVASDRDRAAYEGCVAAILAVASPVAAADDWQSVGPTCPCDLGLPRPDDAGACPAWPNCQQPLPPSAEAATPHADLAPAHITTSCDYDTGGPLGKCGLPMRAHVEAAKFNVGHAFVAPPVSASAQGVGE